MTGAFDAMERGLIGDRFTVAAIPVGAHLLAYGAHGVVHGLIPVWLTVPQAAFVVLVVGAAPVVAVATLRKRHRRAGGTLLALSMGGSLGFGVAFHFLLETPDHVHAVPAGPWHDPFAWTAVIGAVADAAGALVGLWIATGGSTAGLTRRTAP